MNHETSIRVTGSDRYTPLARLGAGGQAEVYLAIHRGFGGFEKLVVLKRLLPHLSDDIESRSRLAHEAQLAAMARHPNVCQVLNLIENDGDPVLVMEFLNGITVNEVASALPEHRSIEHVRFIAGVLIQACEGLHAAHELRDMQGKPAQLVHRDVSSNNILVTQEGIAKLLDFGIAKSASSDLSKVGEIRGTAAFMSPEQVEGKELDRRSDLFSLGVVAYESLTGRGLFRRRSLGECFEAVVYDMAPDMVPHQPAVPMELQEVVFQALAKSRDRRYSSAQEMGEALARAVEPLGGPMRIGEIASFMSRSFGDLLDARSQEVKSLKAVASSKAEVSAPGELANLPTLETTRSPATVPARPPKSDLEDDSKAMPVGAPSPTPRSDPSPVVPGDPERVETHVTHDRRRPLAVAAGFVLLLAAVASAALWARGDSERKLGVTSTPDASPASLTMEFDAAPITVADGAVADGAVADDAVTETRIVVDAGPLEEPPPQISDQGRRRKRSEPVRKESDKKKPGFFTIDSRPFAFVEVDGKSLGRVPIFRHPLPPGKHRVVARLEDGRTQRFSITIRDGEDVRKRLSW